MKDKFILDACCGGRCFWFNKNHPNTLYIDNRIRECGHDPHRPSHSIKPDKVMDFRNLTFENNSFKMVVWDPPHLIGKEDSCRIIKKYGCLNKETWPLDLKKGFDECWRVLEDYGVLIFKWSEGSISVRDVLNVFLVEPLFGHTTGRAGKTKWMCFMKIPKQNRNV